MIRWIVIVGQSDTIARGGTWMADDLGQWLDGLDLGK